jgi:hypothetical protein
MIFSVLKNYTENRISVIHFWNRFGFYKTDSEPTFGFPHIPRGNVYTLLNLLYILTWAHLLKK